MNLLIDATVKLVSLAIDATVKIVAASQEHTKEEQDAMIAELRTRAHAELDRVLAVKFIDTSTTPPTGPG